MNTHEESSALLPFYVSGELTENEYIQVKRHLEECAECREELEMWRSLSEVMEEDYKRVKAPQGVLKRALETIRKKEERANSFLKSWEILRAQVPLVNKDIWPASLLILFLGFAITIIMNKAEFLYAIAPLVSAGGLAFVYSREHDPAFELVLSTPVSQVQILLARLALVFGYNFVLMLILSLGLSFYYSIDLILPLLLEWLAPMTFLSTLGLCISVFSNSGNAIFISYGLWISKYLMFTQEFRNLLGGAGEVLLYFWQTPAVLYGISVFLLAAVIIYVERFIRITRSLT
jgi:hypothetical protein